MLMMTQAGMKTGYEIIILPLTNFVVRKIKKLEGTDVYDEDVSYNPFKFGEL